MPTEPSEPLAKEIEKALCCCTDHGTPNLHDIDCPANYGAGRLNLMVLFKKKTAALESAVQTEQVLSRDLRRKLEECQDTSAKRLAAFEAMVLERDAVQERLRRVDEYLVKHGFAQPTH